MFSPPEFCLSKFPAGASDMPRACAAHMPLFAVIENLLDLQHKLRLFILIFTPVRALENIVVKGSPRDTERVA